MTSGLLYHQGYHHSIHAGRCPRASFSRFYRRKIVFRLFSDYIPLLLLLMIFAENKQSIKAKEKRYRRIKLAFCLLVVFSVPILSPV